jgi:hypothetical protein
MTRCSLWILCGVVAVFATLATPSTSSAQDNSNFETAEYPLGNRLFDRWIDNRRMTRGRIFPQLIVGQYSTGSGYANGYVAPLDNAPWHWARPEERAPRMPILPWRRR